MKVRDLILASAGALALALAGCKSCKKNNAASPAPDQAAAADAGPAARKRIPSPSEPDPGYEARRDELLRRGDPAMMKPAPVFDAEKAAATNPADLIKVISRDVMMVQRIKVDLAAGTAEIPARLALESGLLEYVAVTLPGKAYESLLTIDCTVVELRLALTLLGYEGAQPAEDGQVAAPSATDTVTVDVRIDGKDLPVSAVLVDRKTGKAPPPLGWQVIGFRDADRTAALTSLQQLTLVSRDTTAPLRVIGELGNPYAGPDVGLAPNADVLPPVGSELTLVIRRGKDAPPVKAGGSPGQVGQSGGTP